MNVINLIGRATRDPELRTTQSGTSVASLTLAVDRPKSKDKEKETDFIDCVLWGVTADTAAKYVKKGQQIGITGRLQIRNWEDKEGNKRRAAEVVVERFYFCGNKADGNNANTGASTAAYSAAPSADSAEFADVSPDDDLPFEEGL